MVVTSIWIVMFIIAFSLRILYAMLFKPVVMKVLILIPVGGVTGIYFGCMLATYGYWTLNKVKGIPFFQFMDHQWAVIIKTLGPPFMQIFINQNNTLF